MPNTSDSKREFRATADQVVNHILTECSADEYLRGLAESFMEENKEHQEMAVKAFGNLFKQLVDKTERDLFRDNMDKTDY